MKVIVNESGFINLLTEMVNNQTLVNIKTKIEQNTDLLEKFLKQYGKIMINIQNNKEYLVYELLSLTDLIGKRYGLVQLIKDGEPFQSIYVKPIELYKLKNF